MCHTERVESTHYETSASAQRSGAEAEPSVREVINADGSRSYEVRWMQGGVRRSRRFADVDHAERLWVRLRRARRDPERRAALSGQVTLMTFFDGEWLSWVAQQPRNRARNDQAGHMRNYALPRLGKLKLAEITRQEIQHMQLDMARCGESNGKIAKTMAGLSNVMKLAAELDCVAENPVPLVVRPASTRPKITQLALAVGAAA